MWSRSISTPARCGIHATAQSHRAPAPVVGRPGHAAGHAALHALGAGGRALVPGQHRVHPSHQRARFRRRGPRHPLQRQLPGDGTGRRVPGRAGGHATGSAASTGHHQVQPGAHLDSGECGGHWRRLPVRVRNGRARRLPVRRPHGADVESLSATAPTFAASPGCCGSSTRSASIRSVPRNCCACARALSTERSRCASKTLR